METLTIDLKKKKSFEIGQQGDHNALCIHFINMKNVGTNKKYIYYTIDGIENCVPLTNDRFIVGYPLTAHSGIASAQLISKLNDNTIIKLSNVFAMHIKESKGYKDSGEYPVDPNIQSSYDLLDDLIDQTQDLINNYNYATLMEKLTQASSEATTSATTAKKCADELKSSTDFINTLDDKVAAQDSKIEKIEASTSHITTKQNTKIAALQTRMSEFTSLKEGSTTGDAELIDARIGADGTKYLSAGDAIRGQIEQLNEDLDDVITPNFNLIDTANILPVSDGQKYRKFKVVSGETYFFNVLANGITAWTNVFNKKNVRIGSIDSVFGVSTWNSEVTIPDNVGYISILADSDDRYAKTMYWGYKKNYSYWQNRKNKSLKQNILVPENVVHIGNGTNYNIKNGLDYAVKNNLTAIINPGTYDLVEEGISGSGNKSPKHLIGYGVTLKADLPTENWEWSPLNVDYTRDETIVEGLTIEVSNCRYCIHDEMYNRKEPYHNVFKNLRLIHKSKASSVLVAPHCIGGGLGNGGCVEIENVIANANLYKDISYHSCAGTATQINRVYVKDSMVKHCVEVARAGQETDFINKVYVTNCILGRQPLTDVDLNIQIIPWNNVIDPNMNTD